MTEWYIYAKDYSGSTSGCTYYHTKGLETFRCFEEITNKEARDPLKQKIAYLHWESKCQEVTKEDIVRDYKNKRGSGGTYPLTILHWMSKKIPRTDKIKYLYIITDGECYHESMINYHDINHVKFFAFNTHNRLDLSVAASFFCSNCQVYDNDDIIYDVNIGDPFDYDSINTTNYVEKLDKLQQYIQLKYINSKFSNAAGELQDIERLKNLRKRLIAEFSGSTTSCAKLNDNQSLDDMLHLLKHCTFYKDLFDTKRQDINGDISRIISYIESTNKSVSFNALKRHMKYESNESENVVMDEQEDLVFLPNEIVAFEDIVMYEDTGVPVILFVKANLLDSVCSETHSNFSKFATTLNCPLYLLGGDQLNNSIEYYYTFEVYKELVLNHICISPHSGQVYSGGIVLSEQFDRYNDYMIDLTYFNGKKVQFNRGLFYYVLYKISESKSWMDQNVLNCFKTYVFRRIKETICPLALSSLPLDPKERVSLPTALWYCVELSSHLFMDDKKLFHHERLRMFYSVAEYMIEILEYYNYPLNLPLIKKRCEVFRYLTILKRIDTEPRRVQYILQMIFRTTPNGLLVAEIQHPKNISLLRYLHLNHKEIVSSKEDESVVDVNKYAHFMYHLPNLPIEISKSTLRPLFVTNKSKKSFYFEYMQHCREISYDPNIGNLTMKHVDKLNITKVVSLNKAYLLCVVNKQKIPTLEEFYEYVLKTMQFKNSQPCIFSARIESAIEDIYDSYRKLIKNENISTEQFITRALKSVNRFYRIKLESSMNSSTDKEILDFINSEENLYIDKKFVELENKPVLDNISDGFS